MFIQLGKWIARRWWLVIALWLALVLLVRCTAPRWEDVARDGDFAYLPNRCASVAGQRLLEEMFPQHRSKSQMVILVVRPDAKLSTDDIFVANDLARRLRNVQGVASCEHAEQLARQADELERAGQAEAAAAARHDAEAAWSDAERAFQEAIRLDRELAEYRHRKDRNTRRVDRLAEAYHNLAVLWRRQGKLKQATAQRQIALRLDPSLAAAADRLLPPEATGWPLIDLWTWHDEVVGRKLISRDEQARLIILHLSNEFLATDNIRVIELVERQLAPVRQQLNQLTRPGLQIALSGSAAVGGDLLRAARDSIRHTELFTVVLVVLILAVVYRSPLLVAVPLVTIGCSLVVATGLIALLCQLGTLPGWGWWDLKVFTTTKIFIVVILFGSGTDFCLFLISRYKEELQRGGSWAEAVARALAGVGDAVTASALTTIVGLSTMLFAEFGKFRNSGPVIALCLAIALLACLTLAPAMLRALGGLTFWPFRPESAEPAKKQRFALRQTRQPTDALWRLVARPIVSRPGLVLTVSFLVLFPLAGYGLIRGNRVTYDFLSTLSAGRPSRQGTQLLRQHFPVGESGPVMVLVQNRQGHFDTEQGRLEIARLTQQLYLPSHEALVNFQRRHPAWHDQLEQVLRAPSPAEAWARLRDVARRYPPANELLGVVAVRSIADPLGDYPPGRKVGLFSRRGWRTRMMRPHRMVEQLFVAHRPGMASYVARFDVLLKYDPFSLAATQQLEDIDRKLREISRDVRSPWHGAAFAYAGTTAAIADLRQVTQSDTRRIQLLVVIAVLAVLLMILRRPIVCLYMVASVLLSYFVTLGVTQLFFQLVYAPDFQGLDWKVPVFLFVILVAVGQDYNVYLATRVFEEQAQYGPFAGLRRAVVLTGGIITSCGVIMAGTFLSMTSGSWRLLIPTWLPLKWLLPATSGGPLASIVELGFALSLGVLLDTLVVRPVLLPAFLALLCRWRARSKATRLMTRHPKSPAPIVASSGDSD